VGDHSKASDVKRDRGGGQAERRSVPSGGDGSPGESHFEAWPGSAFRERAAAQPESKPNNPTQRASRMRIYSRKYGHKRDSRGIGSEVAGRGRRRNVSCRNGGSQNDVR